MEIEGARASDAQIYEEMGRRFLGLGNIGARHWFCGLEPGGTDAPNWPRRWATYYHGAEVIDGRLEVNDPTHARFFGPNASLQRTWGPLISTFLAFRGERADEASALEFQRDHFHSGDGATCLLELSGYAAPNLSIESPRDRYLAERTLRIRELMALHRPYFLLCYGVKRRQDFEQLVGGPFDDQGFRNVGPTVCALVRHPRPARGAALTSEWWVALGRDLRRRSDALGAR